MKTINESGLQNNYPSEPPVYFAQYPDSQQQRSYAFQGAIAVLFITLLVLTTFAIN